MSDFRPLLSLAPVSRPVLFVDASQGALALFEAGQERLNAARQLALTLQCSDESLEDSGLFATFRLLLDEAAGLYETAFERRGVVSRS